MKKIFFVPIALCFMAGFHAAKAEVRLAGIFADNMVLQREQPVKIWGRADRNELVTVLFNGRKHRTRADRDGAWSVVLEPMPAGVRMCWRRRERAMRCVAETFWSARYGFAAGSPIWNGRYRTR